MRYAMLLGKRDKMKYIVLILYLLIIILYWIVISYRDKIRKIILKESKTLYYDKSLFNVIIRPMHIIKKNINNESDKVKELFNKYNKLQRILFLLVLLLILIILISSVMVKIGMLN